jgi:hypothetical protein
MLGTQMVDVSPEKTMVTTQSAVNRMTSLSSLRIEFPPSISFQQPSVPQDNLKITAE